MNIPLFLSIFAVVSVFAFHREIGAWLRERRERPKRTAERSAWRSVFESENPDAPPLTREEIDEFKAWRASLALPAVELRPAPERPVAAGGTRIGGPVWLGYREKWPVDARGVPLEFVAQVDFADLPPLADFPETGLLQFFVGRDDLYGLDFDDPPRGPARVLWRPDALERGDLHPQPEATPEGDSSPFELDEVRDAGLPLAGQAATHPPGASDWRITKRLRGQYRREGIEEIEELLYGDEHQPPTVHHVGGHPVFTQDDIRRSDRYDEFDRTLLRLTSEGNLLWGDVGEAVFLIRHRDLLARDFSTILFTWDCT